MTTRGFHIVTANAMSQAEYIDEVSQQRKKRSINTLVGQLIRRGLPQPAREKRNLYPGRDWRADLYWEDAGLVVEYEGGTATHGRALDPETGRTAISGHLTPTGYAGNVEKYNAFAMMGLIVMRAEVMLVRNEVAADQIADVYFARKAERQLDNAIYQLVGRRFGNGPDMLRGLMALVQGGDIA